jgi:short-subunit dehydrogenase
MILRRADNLIALVTGASRGIGRATAHALARRGIHVVLASRSEEALRSLADEIGAGGGVATVSVTDVTERSQVHRLVEETLDRLGRIDICICNAGVYIRGPVHRSSIEDVERSMAVNFYGSLYLIHTLLPHMVGRRKGHLVVVSSVDGKKGLPLDAPYVAAKFALTGYMDVLRQELHGTGVEVSTVLPGRVDTAMISDLRVPLVSRKISAARVAAAIVRAIEKNRAELVVPFMLPKFLIVASAISARFGDWQTRLFRLEGEEKSA